MNGATAFFNGKCANYTSSSATSFTAKVQQGSFKMPLHYPRINKSDYEIMPEWQLDCLLSQYGLPATGDLAYKRKFAMGAFLWPPETE